MDSIFQALLSWQLLMSCLAIAAVTFVVRKVAEYLMDNYTSFKKEAKLWTDLILPIFPVLFGSITALAFKGLPFPDGITSGSARFACGLVSGMLSGLVFRILKSFLFSKVNLPAETSDEENKLVEQVRDTINKD